MNFDLTAQSRDNATFNMVVEILATVWAMKELAAEQLAQQRGIPVPEAMHEIEQLIDRNRKAIDRKMDEDYGHVDLGEIE